jgi:hypothetical protein
MNVEIMQWDLVLLYWILKTLYIDTRSKNASRFDHPITVRTIHGESVFRRK